MSKPSRTQTFTSASDGRTWSRLWSHFWGGRPTCPRKKFRKPYTGSYIHCQMRAAATSETENGRKYIAVHALRHRRLSSRWRPSATARARITVAGTDRSSRLTVFRTACQNVGSVNTRSYRRKPTNWLAPPGTVR